MDQNAFDRIAKVLGGAASRRSGLRAALGAAFGLAAFDGAAGAKGRGRGAGGGDGTSRRPKPEGPCGDGSRKSNTCSRNAECCTGYCQRKRHGEKNAGRCRCLRRGRPCTATANCCGAVTCQDGFCGGARLKVVATGQPCGPRDTCRDPNATCTSYRWNAEAGTFCLLPTRALCSKNADCASDLCDGGECVPCSVAACAVPCSAVVCAGCAHTTVQAAIDAASAGDIIDIGQGTWREDLTVSKNLTLRSCPGKRATLVNATYGSRTIAVSGAAALTLLDITVAGYNDYGNGDNGGGVTTDGDLTLAGTSTIRDCFFDTYAAFSVVSPTPGTATATLTDRSEIRRNRNKWWAGGAVKDGNLIVNEQAVIRDNEADSYTAGLLAKNSNCIVTGQAVFENNRANGDTALSIVRWHSPEFDGPIDVRIDGDVQFINNISDSYTAPVAFTYVGQNPTWNGTLTIGGNVEISGNTSKQAGGLFIKKAPVVITDNVRITGNRTKWGGAIHVETANGAWPVTMPPVTIEGNVSITDNIATEEAGGIGLFGAGLILRGSATIARNSGSIDGGGVALWYNKYTSTYATLAVEESATITGNTSATGGGVFSDNAGNSLTAVAGSITGNTPDNCAGLGISCA